MSDSDSELVKQFRDGDAAAFHALVDRHAARLYRLAYALVGNAADAEDAVQETFVAAFRGIAQFEQRSLFLTWLCGILTRQAAMCRRQRKKNSALLNENGIGNISHAKVHAGDFRLDLADALQELPAEFREVVVLRELEGFTYEEIAAGIGIPRGTVESRLYRARRLLRERLAVYSEENRS